MSCIVINFKQGQTLIAQCQYIDDNGDPLSLAGITLASQVRDKNNNVIDDLMVMVTDEAIGQFNIESVGSTLTWPLQTLYWDILTDTSGVMLPTETIQLRMLKSVTRP